MGQGLKCARFLMVIASMSPLFFFWGVKGSKYIPDKIFLPCCAAFIIIPNIILYLRLIISKKNNNIASKSIHRVKDQNDNLLIYLFAMLIPLITGDLDSARAVYTMLGVLFFLVFLFWHLNLYYLNLLFALSGYKVFTIFPNNGANNYTPFVLLTKKNWLEKNTKILAWHISDTVYIEK